MVVDIKKLIAAINPELYCEPKLKSEVKKIAKRDGYLKAAEKAELKESDYIDVYYTQFTKGPFALAGFKAPIEQHKLVYDDFSQSLEQVYFWILDYVNKEYGKSQKLIDNFIASPGSGLFSEFGQKTTRMQEEGMKIFGVINTVVRSVLNLIYDLKEFKIRLGAYDDYQSKNENKKQAAFLALKQIWMDRVDINRGAGSINGLAQQLDFITLRDAFMAVKTLKDVKKIDLNERVKRILMQRFSEFLKWFDESERELRKRFEIEKSYLKSQINSLKLYARWAKPYLKTAKQLEQNMSPDAALVNAFNTSLFELVLLAEGKYETAKDVGSGELPKFFNNLKLRKYFPITIVEFYFRSVPERTDQRGGYGFRGRVEISFTSFALNEDEMKVLRDEVEKDDFGDVYKMIEDATEKSFEDLEKDIEDLLGAKSVEKKEKNEGDVNPFSALFSFLKRDKSEKKEEKKDLSKGISSDSDYEKVIRNQAILLARINCRKLYDGYKKAIGIPAFPPVINF